MAGAVGMEGISPMPARYGTLGLFRANQIPPATFRPGFSTTMAWISGGI